MASIALNARRTVHARKGLQQLGVALPFMLPGFLLVIVFVLYPLARGVQMSLYDWNLMAPEQSDFVGLKNFQRALTQDPLFWIAVRNTALYAAITVPGQMVLGLGAALLLNVAVRGRAIFRALYYLPVVTSWLVVSYLFAYLFSDGMGPVNFLLVQGLHVLAEPVDRLHQTWTAEVPINLLGIWNGLGLNKVLFLSRHHELPPHGIQVADADRR